MLFRFASAITAAAAFFASANASPSHKQWSTKGSIAPMLDGYSFVLIHSGSELQYATPVVSRLDHKIYVSVNLPPSDNMVGDIGPVFGLPGSSGFAIYSPPIPAPGFAAALLTIREDGHLEYDFNQFRPINGEFTKWQWDEDELHLTYDGYEGGYACKIEDGIWLLYFAVLGRESRCPPGQEGLGVRWRRVPVNNDELR
ncbi:hypothetical protein RUND412_006212 [Rhizina undulata]